VAINVNKDIWVDIVGYEGLYQINAYRQIRRVYKNRPPELIKQFKIKDRYFHKVHLNKNGKSTSFSAEKLLREHLGKIKIKAKHLNFETSEILSLVSKYLQVPVKEITSKKRGKFQVTLARQMCHKLARETTTLSFTKIGEQIGDRNSKTVKDSCKTLNNLIETDKQIAKKYYYLLNKVSTNPNTIITQHLEKIIPLH
jgi:hypothetical protein